MKSSFILQAMICIILLSYLAPSLATDLAPSLATDTPKSLTEKTKSFMKKPRKLDLPQARKATLTLLASELLSRTRENDDVSLVIAVRGSTARFECTGTGAALAACQQKCLHIQAELKRIHASEGGCSSINNGCQCTHDPFEE